MSHENFKKYWESIGKPILEYRYGMGVWSECDSNPLFFAGTYRIKGDPHWELRQKWIDSDFKLPIEYQGYGKCNWIKTDMDGPGWIQDYEYREAQYDAKQNYSDVDIQKTLNDRGNNYGDFNNHALITQHFKALFKTLIKDSKKTLPSYQIEAVEMVFHKLGRIINGNEFYIDSWRDMAGYLQLVVNELERTEGATDCRIVKQVVKDGSKVDWIAMDNTRSKKIVDMMSEDEA